MKEKIIVFFVLLTIVVPLTVTKAEDSVWSTGETYAEIEDSMKAVVTVTNTAGFGGTLITKAAFTTTVPGVINPPQYTEYLEAGTNKTYEFTVHNSGTDTNITFTIKIEVWNEKPELVSETTLTGKLLAPANADNSQTQSSIPPWTIAAVISAVGITSITIVTIVIFHRRRKTTQNKQV